jgi:hypothetical protein
MNDSLEKLARAEHDSWSSWMNWLYRNGKWNEDGSFTISSEKAQRWFKLSVTRYEELDEPTKQFDRDEVKKVKPLLEEAYRNGYNDNARDCYCDGGSIPHKHLLDDGDSHNLKPDLKEARHE